jgi:alcohol dehydrogenase YqhD (iron-dependent ADH family)
MINSELIKLISILTGGFLTIIIGFIIQKKNMKNKNRINSPQLSNNYTNPNEEKAKVFIQTYKNNYSQESIKTSLKQIGMNDTEINSYLNKYY